jgi:hypothetical protein
MFYENERIVRKQQKYELLQARGIILDLQSKGLTRNEISDAVEIMESEPDITEFRLAVLKKVKKLNSSRRENESTCTNTNTTISRM